MSNDPVEVGDIADAVAVLRKALAVIDAMPPSERKRTLIGDVWTGLAELSKLANAIRDAEMIREHAEAAGKMPLRVLGERYRVSKPRADQVVNRGRVKGSQG